MNEAHIDDMRDYLYQILTRNSQTERAISINFGIGMDCYTPVGGEDGLQSPNFSLDVGFIYGEKHMDWVRNMDEDYAENIVEFRNKIKAGSSAFYICPDSGHNIHWNNPSALSSIMINNLLGMKIRIQTIE